MSLGPVSGRDLAQIRWGEALRRQKVRRRRSRHKMAATAALIMTVGSEAIVDPVPRLIWNASASAPIGLYWLSPDRAPKRGEMVAAHLDRAVAEYAAFRGYLPDHVPVVKMVLGVPGDRICARFGVVSVNKQKLAEQLATDKAGRPLDAWRGCRTLKADQYLLLNAGVRDSFDGRYFGPIDAHDILGKVSPLWLR
jgi:conjugative transfer signal peptidase TraF